MRALCTALLALAAMSAVSLPAQAKDEPCVLVVARADQLQLIVPPGARLRPQGVHGESVEVLPAAARAALSAQHADRVELIGGVAHSTSDLRFLRVSSSDSNFDARATARALRATGLFRAVDINRALKLSVTAPDDTFYTLEYQWSLMPAASETPHLPEAWDLARGDTSVVIGILDTGVDIGHPDLKNQIFHNRHEIPGNGIDDDGNGYVDDVNGWDFGNHDNDPRPEPAIDPSSGFDIAIHGTHVAGIAAAQTGNHEGVSSAGWHCRLMPLKLMNAAGAMTEDKAAEAILYAADNGASIINMSFAAAPDSADSTGAQEKAFFQALIDVAIQANIVPVAAAGNEGVSDPRYPAACDSVIAVAATNEYQTMSYYTNWGDWVDINAPGDNIFSTLETNYPVDDLTLLYLELVYDYDDVHPYFTNTGTSMACPLVAGVAGLVRARYPYLTAVQVMNPLKNTGDDEPYDEPIGKKLNAYNAVLANPVTGVPTAPPLAGPNLQAAPSPFRETTSLRFVLPQAGRVSLVVYDASGRVVRELVRGFQSAGPQAVVWDGLDRGGREVPTGIYFASLNAPGASARLRLLRLR